RLVGNVVLHSFHNNYAELGYWRIDEPEVRGKGIVTRSAREVINMGLGHMGLAVVGIEIRPDNVSSRHVAERLGATFLALTDRGHLSYIVTESVGS
ncbi:MAG TPA: GNAT family N-acetyltransferase, partial [Nitrosospira sp.]|nr:GNAT family N-acetyltransferase [Nitrosospira sp.]